MAWSILHCNRLRCTLNYNQNFSVIFIIIASALFLLISTICIFLMGVHSFPTTSFYLTPMISLLVYYLLFIGLVLYHVYSLINGISSRFMITAIVMAYTSFAIVVFIAGRYSIFYQKNPTDFTIQKQKLVKRLNELKNKNHANRRITDY